MSGGFCAQGELGPDWVKAALPGCPWQASSGLPTAGTMLRRLESETSGACLLVPWTLLLWGLIWNRDSTPYYLKHVISLLLSQKRLACFKTMWILKYDVFCLPTDSTIGCFCLTSIKTLVENRSGVASVCCFVICLLASKPAATEIIDNASTLRGWMWRCWVGEVSSLRVWHLKSGEMAFLFLVYNRSLRMKFSGFSITHTNTTVSSSSDVTAQKNRSFLPCYFKSNQFLFGSYEIYANVWAQTAPRRHTPWKDWEGWKHVSELGNESLGSYLQNRQVCRKSEAAYLPSVSVNYPQQSP